MFVWHSKYLEKLSLLCASNDHLVTLIYLSSYDIVKWPTAGSCRFLAKKIRSDERMKGKEEPLGCRDVDRWDYSLEYGYVAVYVAFISFCFHFIFNKLGQESVDAWKLYQQLVDFLLLFLFHMIYAVGASLGLEILCQNLTEMQLCGFTLFDSIPPLPPPKKVSISCLWAVFLDMWNMDQ